MSKLLAVAISVIFSGFTSNLLVAEEYAPLCPEQSERNVFNPGVICPSMFISYSIVEQDWAPTCDPTLPNFLAEATDHQEWVHLSYQKGMWGPDENSPRINLILGPYKDIQQAEGFFVVTRDDGKQNQVDFRGRFLPYEWADEVGPMMPNGVFSSRQGTEWRLHNLRGKVILKGELRPAIVERVVFDPEYFYNETTGAHDPAYAYVCSIGDCSFIVNHMGLNGVPMTEVRGKRIVDCGGVTGYGDSSHKPNPDNVVSFDDKQSGEFIVAILKD